MTTRTQSHLAARRSVLLFLMLALLLTALPSASAAPGAASFAAEQDSLNLNCKSAILMDAATGTVLYEQNADQALPPASVTKIMTLLLVMEAIDGGTLQLSDPISVSETAAGMGGSQIYLEPGEIMSCEDMLKSVVISSANDAAVALAEHIAGDIDTFVRRMNEKATSLGMTGTQFENATGLDDTAEHHLTTARDIAIMSRALIEHKTILQYSSVWMDTIRNGTFGLTNTNRLIRFYRGATGLKTGSTEKAGFCVSVTAARDGLSLICVIMGAENRDIRNAQATKLLDWGFANYANYQSNTPAPEPVRITGGINSSVKAEIVPFCCTLPKAQLDKVEYTVELPECIAAPLSKGAPLGSVTYRLNGEIIGSTPIVAAEDIPRITYRQLLKRLLCACLFH
ncbi:MAG: D-alanyl-D-alanine carboxypeptidase [Clostridia bacterium]|nr:D-alanyl-D-alanine carboxypeptidase [Clostridia bacterium]